MSQARRMSLGVVLLTIAAILTAASCANRNGSSLPDWASGSQSSNPQGPAVGDNTGAVGIQLITVGGEHISQASYTLTNGANTLNGSYNVSAASSLSFVIGSVPAGTGYSLVLTATSDDGSVTCSFPAPGDPAVNNITVLNRTTTVVNVNLQCLVNPGLDAGSVLVNGTTSNCPVWNAIVANPVNITLDAGANVDDAGTVGSTSVYPGSGPVSAAIGVGQSLVLVGAATAPNPGLISFQWTTTGGMLGSVAGTVDPNSIDAGTTDQTTFTCPSTPGSITVTLVVSDGPLPGGGTCDPRFTTGQITVICQAASTGPNCTGAAVGTACGDAGQICNGGGACVVPSFSVVQVLGGDGGFATATAAAVVIQQYLLDGAVTGTPIALPTAASDGGQPFTLNGVANTEGDLSTSVDGRYLTMAGYPTAPGTTNIMANAAIGRAVASIDANGNVTTTAVSNAFLGGSPRSAVSLDGAEFWLSGTSASGGTSGGIWYLPTDQLIVQMPSTALPGDKARLLRIAGGQLYGDSDQDPPYFFSVGTGLPTTTTTVTTLPGLPTTGITPSPYSAVFFDLDPTIPGIDTLYIADDRTSTGGGFEKWTLGTSGNWTMMWSSLWGVDGGVGTGFRGMAGYVTGSTVTLMASSGLAMGNADSLAVILDTFGSMTAPTPQVVATAPPNSTFRGVALPPHL